MKALIKKNRDKGLWLEEVPAPKAGLHDILIRVLRTSLGGTDLSIYLSSEEFIATVLTPLIIGHEFVGEIVEVGSEVVGYHRGQIVSGETRVTCGRCRPCLEGKRYACLNGSFIGITRPGAFAGGQQYHP
jgi:threonine 3-dehydrogenase